MSKISALLSPRRISKSSKTQPPVVAFSLIREHIISRALMRASGVMGAIFSVEIVVFVILTPSAVISQMLRGGNVKKLPSATPSKANSADAITVFGKYVMDTHIKDGFYPTNGKELGREVKVGDGMANIPEVIKRLKAVNYTGNYIIEREISGDQQTKDIKETLEYLKKILSEN